MNKISNNQIPINQSSLIQLPFFISYCQDNGLKINENTLEHLHKLGLIYPALKVFLGVVEFRKIYALFDGKEEWRYVSPNDVDKFKVIKLDPKKYYQTGGLSKFGNNWLDYYFDNKMTELPSQTKFMPWKQEIFPDYYTNTKLIKNQYRFVYDKKQILALKIVLPLLHFIKEDNSDDRKNTIKIIQKRISDLYYFFELYHEIEKFYDSLNTAKKEKVKELRKNRNKGEKITKLELNQEYDFNIFPIFEKLAKLIIKKHNVDINYIYDWREFLAEKCLINESGRSSAIKRSYIKALSSDVLPNLEDSYFMIHKINTFLYFLTKKDQTVKQVLLGFDNKICCICGSNFKPRNYEQKTCGLIKCVTEHKNNTKREQRKLANLRKKM